MAWKYFDVVEQGLEVGYFFAGDSGAVYDRTREGGCTIRGRMVEGQIVEGCLSGIAIDSRYGFILLEGEPVRFSPEETARIRGQIEIYYPKILSRFGFQSPPARAVQGPPEARAPLRASFTTDELMGEPAPGSSRETTPEEVIAYLNADPRHAVVIDPHQIAIFRGASDEGDNFYIQPLPLEDPGDACGGDYTAAEALQEALNS